MTTRQKAHAIILSCAITIIIALWFAMADYATDTAIAKSLPVEDEQRPDNVRDMREAS